MIGAIEFYVLADNQCCWSGESQKFYPAHNRSVLAFLGKFSYNIELLDNDIQKVFILLARFGEFRTRFRTSSCECFKESLELRYHSRRKIYKPHIVLQILKW